MIAGKERGRGGCCPRIKTCQKYRAKRRYGSVEKKRCGWRGRGLFGPDPDGVWRMIG
ncbi:MAG: hypothetical protein QXU06_03865 [Candidatus Bathyarchaeia archaeon]